MNEKTIRTHTIFKYLGIFILKVLLVAMASLLLFPYLKDFIIKHKDTLGLLFLFSWIFLFIIKILLGLILFTIEKIMFLKSEIPDVWYSILGHLLWYSFLVFFTVYSMNLTQWNCLIVPIIIEILALSYNKLDKKAQSKPDTINLFEEND